MSMTTRIRSRSTGAWHWLDERLGITAAIWPIIAHPVPKNINWWYVLGSATLVAFIVQVITGVALAMVYVPSADVAFESVRFITEDTLLGNVIRGTHYWGAAAMVVLIFAHVVRTFLYGSYKYPREFTWISGSVLLLLTLGLAFTGQLLRWDQASFWGIVVAASQASKVPIVGDILMQVVVAGWTVGPATLTRFYATHVFLLPALAFLFIGVHIYLVVRLGISEPPEPGRPVDPRTYRAYYADLLRKGKPFFPDAFWEDAVAAFAVVLSIIALAVAFGPPHLEAEANPTFITTYPRPDWYFLWLFALLALIPDWAEELFIIGLPLLIGIALLALPFIASAGERSPRRRPWAVGIVILSFVAFVAFTVQGYRSEWSPILEGYAEIPYPAEVVAGLEPIEQRGARVFNTQGCHACHAIGDFGGKSGPELTNVADRLERDQLIITILRGRDDMPGFAGTISPEDLDALVAFLETLHGEEVED